MIPCGAELAWARIATPACCRIWVLVKLTISDATSRSLMRDCEALRFSEAIEIAAVVCSSRFWTAPRLPRTVETKPMPVSTELMSVCAAATMPVPLPVAVANALMSALSVLYPAPAPAVLFVTRASANVTVRASTALPVAPIWKLAPVLSLEPN